MSIIELHRKIESSKGYRVHRKLQNLDTTITILNRNYSALVQLNEYLPNNMNIMALKNRDKLQNFQIEFSRHLHNYLASVKTVIDQTRTFKKHLNLEGVFESKYTEKGKEFLSSDSITFIQQLREYIQHYDLLPTGVEIKVNKTDGEKVTLIVSTKDITGFSRWNAKSKRFLERNPENIDIIKHLKDYQNNIHLFYKWFYEEVQHVFIKELDELEKLSEDYQKLRESNRT